MSLARLSSPAARRRKVVFGVVAIVLLVTFVEGASSLLLFAVDAWRYSSTFPSIVRYDPQLGWTNRSNLNLHDFSGPGKHLRSDRRGFRGESETARAIPSGRVRVLCAGDSFTFGDGVGDDETWVHLLSTGDSRLESVNLGVGGYGVDQSYLRLIEAASELDFDVAILAFITNDIDRMRNSANFGYAKPLIRGEGGRVRVTNVPVPRASGPSRWAARNAELVGRLRVAQLVARTGRLTGVLAEPPPALAANDVREALLGIVATLGEVGVERGVVAVLVHLPTRWESLSEESQYWDAFLGDACAGRGVGYVSLVQPFRRMSRADLESLFLRREDVKRDYESGHYSPAGHRLVAELLHAELLADPRVASKVAAACASGVPVAPRPR